MIEFKDEPLNQGVAIKILKLYYKPRLFSLACGHQQSHKKNRNRIETEKEYPNYPERLNELNLILYHQKHHICEKKIVVLESVLFNLGGDACLTRK